MISLITSSTHSFVLNASTKDIKLLTSALGKFSQKDFIRMGLSFDEISSIEKLFSDLYDLNKVLSKSTTSPVSSQN